MSAGTAGIEDVSVAYSRVFVFKSRVLLWKICYVTRSDDNVLLLFIEARVDGRR